MSKTTRGDALASAVGEAAKLLSWLRVQDALSTYRASEPKGGERVRLIVREDYNGNFYAQSPDGCLRDDSDPVVCYIVATIPPRAEPVVVEGDIDG